MFCRISLQITYSSIQRIVDFFLNCVDQPRGRSSLPPGEDHGEADAEDENGEVVQECREQVEVADTGLDRESELRRKLRNER